VQGRIEQSTETISERLRGAAESSPEEYTELLAELWAEEVTATHDPPSPEDGVRDRERMNELNRAATAGLRARMPDLSYRNINFSVSGNEIELTAEIHGTSQDGNETSIPLHWVYTVKDGSILAINSVVLQR